MSVIEISGPVGNRADAGRHFGDVAPTTILQHLAQDDKAFCALIDLERAIETRARKQHSSPVAQASSKIF
jgi:hypothetical protein